MAADVFGPDIEQPELHLLFDYWNVKRGGGVAPAYAGLDVFTPREWLGHLSLLDVLEGGRDFRYRVYGSILAAYYGRDLTGKTLRGFPHPVGDLVRREYAQACTKRRPLLVEHRRRIRGIPIMVAKLILPLSADGQNIDMLIAASYPHP